MNVVAQMSDISEMQSVPTVGKADALDEVPNRSDRIFDGSERPRTVGRYMHIMQRERNDAPDVVNAR